MKEIKYRGWIKEKQEIIDIAQLNFDYTDNYKAIIAEDIKGEWYSIPEEIEIMQYTGFKDENNNEIYENDIVKFKYSSIGFELMIKGIVKFIKGAYYICFDKRQRLLRECSQINVISNKYENPELLTNAQDL